MNHALMPNTAFDRDKIQIDAFRLDLPVAERLKVIVFVASDREFQLRHGVLPRIHETRSRDQTAESYLSAFMQSILRARGALKGYWRDVK
jgi:hypothetical protein